MVHSTNCFNRVVMQCSILNIIVFDKLKVLRIINHRETSFKNKIVEDYKLMFTSLENIIISSKYN